MGVNDRNLRLTWGQRIRAQRKSLGLSQAHVSELLGTTQEQLSRWENGIYAPVDSMRVELARVLRTTVADLFPYPDDTNGDEAAA